MNHSLFVASFLIGRAFWPYSVTIILLMAGLATIFRNELAQAKRMDKVQIFGRLFLAIPMGVFGTDHFIATNIVVAIVPSWIPGHLFWAYFVGVALIAAAASITFKRYAVLAATLLGAMIFSFVLLIHIPNLARYPNSRFLLAVLLRDLSFSGGAFAFAVAEASWSGGNMQKIATTLVRFMIAVPTVFFGVEHFLHPQFVPVVPLNRLTPSWIPGNVVLAYITGSVLVISGLCILVNWRARLAATWLGAVVFIVVLLVYLPIVISSPGDIANGLNYLVDTLAFSGSALLLAGIMPKNAVASLSQEVAPEAHSVTSN